MDSRRPPLQRSASAPSCVLGGLVRRKEDSDRSVRRKSALRPWPPLLPVVSVVLSRVEVVGVEVVGTWKDSLEDFIK